jgi:hypothetical protein
VVGAYIEARQLPALEDKSSRSIFIRNNRAMAQDLITLTGGAERAIYAIKSMSVVYEKDGKDWTLKYVLDDYPAWNKHHTEAAK